MRRVFRFPVIVAVGVGVLMLGALLGSGTWANVFLTEPGELACLSVTTPTGKTEFQFTAGGLDFASSAYQWLVVAGARAQFKGQGRLNGVDACGFLLTAIDGALAGGGGVDRFRIKIWELQSGAIVYDNQMGEAEVSDAATALGGGSIVIHK